LNSSADYSNITRIWEAHPGSQRTFLSSPIWETCYGGTRGPGKTDALIVDFAQHCGMGFGENWRGILFRQTYKQLSDVIAKSKRLFRQSFPGARFVGGEQMKWVWPTGEELLLRHMASPDDYWNYHGHEYPWIGWEELTNWQTSECYESMMACSRSAFPGMPRKYRSTTNPYGKGHNWVKRRFIDVADFGRVYVEPETGNKRVYIHGSMLENTHLMKADPGYVARLKAITNPHKRKAWLYGAWDVTSGGMFDDLWDKRHHVIEPFIIPKTWPVYRAFDWGSSRPFSLGYWARCDGSPANLADGTVYTFPRGTLIRVAEWYGWTGKDDEGCRLLAVEVARQMKTDIEPHLTFKDQIRAGPADTQIFNVDNGKSIADDMGREGIEWTPANKSPGSRKHGAEAMRKLLTARAKRSDEPGILVFSTCRQFVRTVPPIPRDEKDPDDVNSKAEDHCWDETRYMILSEPTEATQESMYD